MMRDHTLAGLWGRFALLQLVLLAYLATRVASMNGHASTSKEFFTLLAQPGIRTIILDNDLSLDLQDAPVEPVNLTADLSIVAGLPRPQVVSLAANYIASKVRLRPNVTLAFERIILSGILRGTGQHLDLLTRSDGGAVVYIHTINHRHACLPFGLFYQQLSSLPPPAAEAGVPADVDVSVRDFWLRNSSLCWVTAGARNVCMAPHLDMVAYGTYNSRIDGVIGNGGYNSFFVESYGVCNRAISEDCIRQKNADLCLAAALAAEGQTGSDSSSGSGNAQDNAGRATHLALGLGLGLGGALLLAVVLIAVSVKVHLRHRREAALAAATPSTHSKAALSVVVSHGLATAGSDMDDLGKGGTGLAAGLKPNGGGGGTGVTAVTGGGGGGGGGGGAAERLADGERADGGKGDLAAGPITAGSTGVTGSSGINDNDSSGETVEQSSMAAGPATAGSDGAGTRPGSAGGLGEVEAARLNLLANAARGRAGRSSSLDVKVLQLLGQGAFGKVYKGIWHGTLVALKAQVLPPSLSGDARRRHMAVMEAAISSAINHPAIVQTYCYSFRPIQGTIQGQSRTVISSNKCGKQSRHVLEEPAELPGDGAVGAAVGDCCGGVDEPGAEDGDGGGGEDFGHELLLVLEYCDGGSLRAALDRGVFHQGRPWPWDWRRAIQTAGQHTAAAGGAGGAQHAKAHQIPLSPPTGAAAAAAAAVAPQSSQPLQGDSTAIANLVAAMIRTNHSGPPTNTLDSQQKRSGQSTGSPSGGAAATAGSAAAGMASTAAAAAAGLSAPGPRAAQHGVATSAARTVGASDLASSVWPKLDAYEPDFTHGAFEVILPAASTSTDASVNEAGLREVAGAAVQPDAAASQQPAAAAAPTALDVFNTLAGAPTAATSFVSSFTNAVGVGTSTADNAAAAAAADRLAMMYLLQQAAAAVAASADPAVGGYAKMLADFISGSTLTGVGSSVVDMESAGDAAAGAAPAPALVSHPADDTIVVPPSAVLAAAAAAATTGPSPPPLLPSQQQQQQQQSASAGGDVNPTRSQASLRRMESSGVASSDVASAQQPQPAVRYGLMLAVAADVASGLLHLHAHGVVHGDVKASNVLLKQIVVSEPIEAAGRALDGVNHGGGGGSGRAPSSAGPAAAAAAHAAAAELCRAAASGDGGGEFIRASSFESMERSGPRLGLCAKVSDFGLSTMLSAANTDSHISATTAAGSLSHMSPELLLCGHVSKANDVYAYGVLLFELFTGERAWEGMPRALLPARVALEGWRPVFPPHTPGAYRQLAERCWLADPAKRPTFQEIVGLLRGMRNSAAAQNLPEWVPVPNPQPAFLQQLALQRRRTPTGSVPAPSAMPTQPMSAAASPP